MDNLKRVEVNDKIRQNFLQNFGKKKYRITPDFPLIQNDLNTFCTGIEFLELEGVLMYIYSNNQYKSTPKPIRTNPLITINNISKNEVMIGIQSEENSISVIIDPTDFELTDQ